MNPDSQNPTQEHEENDAQANDMPQAPTTGSENGGQAPMPTTPPTTPEGDEGDMPEAPEAPAGGDEPAAPAPGEEDKEDGAKW